MTQIIATLSKEADPNLIRQIFDNVKGVIATSITFKKEEENSHDVFSKESKLSPEKKDWLNKLNRLYNSVDRDAIDLNDERTQYILSK